MDEVAEPAADKPQTGQASSPADPQAGQASSPADPPKVSIDRRKGFKLDHILKREAPRRRS